MTEFLFKPSDTVALKTDQNGRPRAFAVLERLTQECCGGVQRHYKLRSFTENQHGTLSTAEFMVLDFEVCAYPTDTEILERCRKLFAEDAKVKAIRKAVSKEAGVETWDT